MKPTTDSTPKKRQPRPQPETRIRTCHVCGERYEYPLRGSRATRFHCELCVQLDEPTRKILERLSKRLRTLETRLKKLEIPKEELENREP